MITRVRRQLSLSHPTGPDSMNSSHAACSIAIQQHSVALEPLIIWIASLEQRIHREAVKSAHLWKTLDRHMLREQGGSENSWQTYSRYLSSRSLHWSHRCLTLKKRALKLYSQAKMPSWNWIQLIVVMRQLNKKATTEKLRRASAHTKWLIIGWLTIKTAFKALNPKSMLLSSKLSLHG